MTRDAQSLPTSPPCVDIDADAWLRLDEWEARHLCLTCPILLSCRQRAYLMDVRGVMGCTNESERVTWRRYANKRLPGERLPRGWRKHRKMGVAPHDQGEASRSSFDNIVSEVRSQYGHVDRDLLISFDEGLIDWDDVVSLQRHRAVA